MAEGDGCEDRLTLQSATPAAALILNRLYLTIKYSGRYLTGMPVKPRRTCCRARWT